MATNSVYSIGQYRSTSTVGTYLTNLTKKGFTNDVNSNISFVIDTDEGAPNENGTPEIETPTITTIDRAQEDAVFRDKAIILTESYNSSSKNPGCFSQEKTYFLRLEIPRNVAHAITYDIKMVSLVDAENPSETGETINYFYNNNASYQHLKRVTVKQGSNENGALTKTIVVGKLKEKGNDDSDNIVASIVDYNDKNFESKYCTIIKDEEKNILYYTRNNEEKLEIDKYVELAVDTSELIRTKNNEYINNEVVEILFKPLNNKFNGIVIEKVRETLDYNSQFKEKVGDKEVVYYGIYTDAIGINLYEVNNLLKTEANSNAPIQHSSLNKIGVWSHSGLCMCINGEEIRIGARGYYEVDIEDFNITEFGVVVEDPNFDKFLVDYEYSILE